MPEKMKKKVSSFIYINISRVQYKTYTITRYLNHKYDYIERVGFRVVTLMFPNVPR